MSNCEGNVYHIGMGCCVPKIVNPDLYYTKEEVDEKIDDIEVSGVTEEKAEEMIDNALEGYYSKGETDDLIGGLEEVDAAISGAVDSLDETVDGISNKVQTLYSELSERAVTSSFAADVQSDYIDLQFTYKSGWGEDEDNEIKYVELPSATTQKAGVMSARDKTKLDNTYTKTEVDAKIPSLVGYATEAFVTNYTYDKQTIEDMIEEGGGFLPENYYDKAATDALLAKKANTATTYTKTNVNNLLAAKADTATTYTKDEINTFMDTFEAADSVISGAVDNVSNELHNNYYTKGSVLGEISAATSVKADVTALTQTNNALATHRSDSGIHVTPSEKETWNNKSDFSGDYNDLTNKPTIPVVPTNVSAFNNDSGYITSSAISGKADTTAVTQAISAAVSGKADSNTVYTKTEVDTALSGKQNTLTAGSGITISNNTISAKIWSGTKAQYEALTTKDSDTIYLIYNE